MMLRIFTAAIVLAPVASLVEAADPQLLNLVMPDAQILAGVNVDQAKTSAFGQYIITQIQTNDPHFQQFITQTGFDPTQDLDELLVASNGATTNPSHLTLARGTFNASQIDAAATKAGATSEVYNGISITENPKHTSGFAFLSGTLAVAGDIASVKGAIDRQNTPTTLPSTLLGAVTTLSATYDAWGVSEVPPPAFKPPANAPSLPNVPATLFQNVQQASGGVKFGPQITVNAQLTTDTAQNATALSNVLQFLLNLGQMKEQQNAPAAAALQSVQISTSGTTVTIAASIPEADVEALAKTKNQAGPSRRRPRGQGQVQPQRF
jgi:hypothetical protein